MWYLDTEHPIAVDSFDHLYPVGTKDDNYKSGNFNTKLINLFNRQKISVLDLGCAGGGFVESLIELGHIAVGLEGSDYSLNIKRAAWATVPDSLFTCDITYPFVLHQGDSIPYLFDVATAWEVVEHIETEDLPMLFQNMRIHLKDSGLFIMTTPRNFNRYPRSGVDHHRTRKPAEWWDETITGFGFQRQPDIEEHFGRFWLRDGKVRRVFRKC
jgi:2-polyprenyl-3-methyl-5-hydroxy-6-metoxy-1,4-benzoquinol methylase